MNSKSAARKLRTLGISLGVLIKMGQTLMESTDAKDIRGSPQFGEPVKHPHSQAHHRRPYTIRAVTSCHKFTLVNPTPQNLAQRCLLVTEGGWGHVSENPVPR